MHFFEQQWKKGRLIKKYLSLLFEEIPLSPKLEVCGENEVDIRNQRPRLRRKTNFSRKSGVGGDFLQEYQLVYSYVIEVADSESDFGLHKKALVSEILLFIRIKVTHFAISSNKINIYLQLNDFFCTTIRRNNKMYVTLI